LDAFTLTPKGIVMSIEKEIQGLKTSLAWYRKRYNTVLEQLNEQIQHNALLERLEELRHQRIGQSLLFLRMTQAGLVTPEIAEWYEKHKMKRDE
jgi:hypothetical protein